MFDYFFRHSSGSYIDKRWLNYNNINEAFIFDDVLLMGIAYDRLPR